MLRLWSQREATLEVDRQCRIDSSWVLFSRSQLSDCGKEIDGGNLLQYAKVHIVFVKCVMRGNHRIINQILFIEQ